MAIVPNLSLAPEYYFGHNLRHYFLVMMENEIYDSAIELDKGVKIFLTKGIYGPNNKGAIYDYIQLHAGRGNNFRVKESFSKINWEETDKLGEYKPKWRKL